jgi:hypothetical protein
MKQAVKRHSKSMACTYLSGFAKGFVGVIPTFRTAPTFCGRVFYADRDGALPDPK